MDATHILLMFAGVCVFFLWMRSFDAIVCYIAERRRELWIARGQPPGFLRVPVGAGWWRGTLARQRLVGEIFMYMPPWMSSDPFLRRAWRRMFSLTVLCWLVPIAMGINAVVRS